MFPFQWGKGSKVEDASVSLNTAPPILRILPLVPVNRSYGSATPAIDQDPHWANVLRALQSCNIHFKASDEISNVTF